MSEGGGLHSSSDDLMKTLQLEMFPLTAETEKKKNPLPDTDPLHVSIETEDIEDTVGVHLGWVQSIQHDDWRLSVAAVLSRRRGRRSVAGPVASPPAASHRGTHAPTLVGRRSIALVVAMVTTT